ncbi:hypothetical protein AB205_0123800, partial [Aquarana catesbeiana]
SPDQPQHTSRDAIKERIVPAASTDPEAPLQLPGCLLWRRITAAGLVIQVGTRGHRAKDLWSPILALPTKADIEGFVTRMERALRQDIEALQADTAHIGGRVETLEASVEDITPTLQALQTHCQTQDQRIDSLLDQLDDVENCSRRVNIRIRGLTEATAPKDIVPTLQGVFKQILGREAPAQIEIDPAHMALRPLLDDPDKPRDICKLHKYSLKERIMHVRGVRHMDFDGAKLSVFPDLSRHTLMQRRALKPMLEVLQKAYLVYCWGVPFSLSGHHSKQVGSALFPLWPRSTYGGHPRLAHTLRLQHRLIRRHGRQHVAGAATSPVVVPHLLLNEDPLPQMYPDGLSRTPLT